MMIPETDKPTEYVFYSWKELKNQGLPAGARWKNPKNALASANEARQECMIRTQICVRKTPDANSNNNISFICMTISRYSIASFNIKLHTNDYNAMITVVNQVSSV